MKRAGVGLILFLAFCGVANASYLAQHQEDGTVTICSISNLSGCTTLAENPYSFLFGVPIVQYGVLFFGIIFVLAALELVIFDELLRRSLMWMSLIGVVVSLYLVFVEVFVMSALCTYCLASAVIALSICILATLIHVKQKSTPPKSLPPASIPRLLMPPSAP